MIQNPKWYENLTEWRLKNGLDNEVWTMYAHAVGVQNKFRAIVYIGLAIAIVFLKG